MYFSDFFRTDPFREMDRLQKEMNRLFSTFTSSGMQEYPAVNIWTNNEGAVVTTEVPGYDPKDIQLSVTNDMLTLSGSRPAEELKEGEQYHRQERNIGSFERKLQLPFAVESNKVDASFKNGVLTVTLPRAEAEKPKKIAIKSN